MNILAKFKETAVSVLPVILIVLALGLTVAPLEKLFLVRFVISGLLLIFGLTLFLLGVDLSIQPMGERSGAALTAKKSLPLLLITAFVIGFIVTAAEPDIQVFSDQVKGVFSFVNKNIFTFSIAIGVGIFIMIGLLRTVLKLSLKITLLISYIMLFAVSFFVPNAFIGIAFDSGGATTGPMTVPFIMSLGIGVARVMTSKDENSSFGLTGIASIGPVLAVLIYGIISLNSSSGWETAAGAAAYLAESGGEIVGDGVAAQFAAATVSSLFREIFHEALLSILPIFALFVIFQLWLLKMTARQVTRIVIGFIYSFAGLIIFLHGVHGGFSQAGAELGRILGQNAMNFGGGWYVLLIVTGLILGAIIVCAEPAVWVLSEQVEQVSGGTIKRKMLLVFLSVGTAIAIGIALWRAVNGFSLKTVLIPGYALAMLLMIFCPTMFSGIAFDSGGVASGPLTSTFVLSFTIGAANGGSGESESFGVIALVAMMPLIAIQIMGIVFKMKQKRTEGVVQNV
ncbi:DUF1538 domain-containing protein [Treponema sp. C6A8]|uniref:DUF1538 domain-containing protein n=1 Tax=Treponema sp. C6A8 TaxID=1410609 RepID=UPI000485796B|nr:DUF1538 domain-containing protein [Treponema sp. C6A8]